MKEGEEDPAARAAEKKRLGNEAFQAKQFDDAIGHYTEAIAIQRSAVFFSNRSACYGAKGDWEKATEDAKECLSIDPNFLKGYWRLATAQMERRQWEDAQVTLTRAIEKAKAANDPALGELTKSLNMAKAKARQAQRQQRQPAASRPRELDAATQKELQDLSMQFVTLRRDRQEVEARISASELEIRRIAVTAEAVSKLPEETPVYRAVGKAFLRSNIPAVLSLKQRESEAASKLKAELQPRLQFLTRRLNSTHANIADLQR